MSANLKRRPTTFFSRATAAAVMTLLLLIAVPVAEAFASTTAYFMPNTARAYGNKGWSNVILSLASDDQYATVVARNKKMRLGGFNITGIPGNSVINGIEVSVEGNTDGRQAKVALTWNGGLNWSTTQTTNVTVQDPDSITTLGGSNSKWGHTWLVEEFTNANFYVQLTSNNGGGTLSLDQLQVRIYYSPPDTTLSVQAATAAYGDSTVQLSASLTETVGGAPLSGKTIAFSLDGVFVGNGTTDLTGLATYNADISTLGAGLYSNYVRADFAGGGGYDATYGVADLTITGDPLIVTADPQEKVYNNPANPDPALTYSIAGLADGDSCTVSLSREVGEDAGSYEILADSISCPPNYFVSYVSDFLTIDPYDAVLTVTNSPVTYNGSPQSATLNSDIAGSISNVMYDGSSTAPTNAAAYAVTADFVPSDTTFCGADVSLNCESLSGASAGNFEIQKAAATVTLGDLSTTYNGSPQGASATTNPASLTVDFTYDGNSTEPTDAGNYAVVGTINDTNYEGSSGDTFVIGKAALSTVTADDKTKVYGDPDPTFTATYAPLLGSDTNGDIDSPSTCSVEVEHIVTGDYPITCTGGDDNNYDFTGATYNPGTLTITGPMPGSSTFISQGGKDGWVLESTETSSVGGLKNVRGKYLRVGDSNLDQQYRSILSFNTATLIPSNASLTGVTLKVRFAGVTGKPFKGHGLLMVDVRTGTFKRAKLQLSDWQNAATVKGAATIANTLTDGWYTVTIPDTGLLNRTGLTQFRLRFSKGDDDDLAFDFLKLYSGNAILDYRPQLIVDFTTP